MKVYQYVAIIITMLFMPSRNIAKDMSDFITSYKAIWKRVPSIITQIKIRSRFGDCVINYAKAKYLSYVYSLPLYYAPFQYSDLLGMHIIDEKYDDDIKNKFETVMAVGNTINKKPYNVLYISDYPKDNTLNLYQYAIENPSFAAEMKKVLTPLSVPDITLPSDIVTVALHIRTGGGYDKLFPADQYFTIDNATLNTDDFEKKPRQTYYNFIYPAKFPPEQYYVDQLIILSELLDDTPLYVHIFTDEADTHSLAERIKKAVNKDNIVYDYREKNNKHDLNVIEDFYAMSLFDCLIRPDSLYTLSCELLGNHKIIIYPKEVRWLKDILLVCESEIKIPNHKNNTVYYASIKKNSWQTNTLLKRKLKDLIEHS